MEETKTIEIENTNEKEESLEEESEEESGEKVSKYKEGQKRIRKGVQTIFSGGRWRRKCSVCDNVVVKNKVICSSCKNNISKSEEEKLIKINMEKKIKKENIEKLEKEYKGSVIETFKTCSEYLLNILSDKFNINFKNKNFRPKDKEKYARLLLKTTSKPNDSKYSFRLVNGNDGNKPRIYILMTLYSKRIWIIKSGDLKTDRLSIGINSSPSYGKYEVTIENINDILLKYYNEIDESYFL